MVLKKRIIFIVIVVLVALLSLYVIGFNAFTYVFFPDRMVKDTLVGFIRQNFNKAIRFDDAFVDISGNIIVTGLNVSHTSDFNDNVSLVKCERAVIDTSFVSLLSRSIVVHGVTFRGAEVTLMKRAGVSYADNFKRLFVLSRPLAEIPEINRRSFLVEIFDSRLVYRDMQEDDALVLQSDATDIAVRIDGENVRYRVSGKLQPHRGADVGTGRLRVSGTVVLPNDGKSPHSEASVEVAGLDITLLNPLFAGRLRSDLFIRGLLGVSAKIATREGRSVADASVEVEDLVAERVSSESGAVALVSDLSFKARGRIEASNDANEITLRDVRINDGNLDCRADVRYRNLPKDRTVDLALRTNRFDLARLTRSLAVLRGTDVAGFARLDARLIFDHAQRQPRDVRASLDADGFSLARNRPEGALSLMRDGALRLRLDGDRLAGNASVASGDSRSSVAVQSVVKSWTPFVSQTMLSVFSDRLTSRALVPLATAAFDALHALAMDDRRYAYDEIPFPEKPLGKLVNGNTVMITCAATTLVLSPANPLRGLFFSLILSDGSIKLKHFNLEGYGGGYSADVFCNFTSGYPFMSFKAKAKNMDLGAFAKDAGWRGTIGGLMNAEIEYQASVSKPSQFIENGQGALSIEVYPAELSGTAIQSALIAHCRDNGIDATALQSLKVARAWVALRQSREQFFVSRLNVTSDVLNLDASGTFPTGPELSIPFTAKLTTNADDKTAGAVSLPAVVKGVLSRPLLFLGTGDRRGMPLFHLK